MPSGAVGVMGTSFEVIVPMTNTLTLTDGNFNLIHGISGLGGGKTVTLPTIAEMVASQNLVAFLVNASGSGGTITIAAATGDSIVGATTALVATGRTLRHDGIHTWFIF